MGALISLSSRCVLVVAAPKECEAVGRGFGIEGCGDRSIGEVIRLDDRFDLVRSGVGKTNASAASAIVVSRGEYGSVVSIGIGGALPGDDPISIGEVMVASRSVFSDEGVGTPGGFLPMSELGFGPFDTNQDGIDHDSAMVGLLTTMVDRVGVVATVSWCSGEDGCAMGVVKRTAAICEAMEGASVALGAKRVDPDILTGEIRVISNTTGDRDAQEWDLGLSFRVLEEVARSLRSLG